MCLLRRREFLLGASSVLFTPKMAAWPTQSYSRDTVVLEDDVTQFTPTFAAQVLDKIRTLVDNPGTELRMQFLTMAGDTRTLTFSFREKQGASHPYLVVHGDDGRSLSLLHDGNGPLSSMRFLGAGGKPLAPLREKLRRFWEGIKDQLSGDDMVALGITAVALALAVWIGATVGKVILVALAFFAFYAVVIGLIVGGTAIILSLLKKRYGSTEEAIEAAKKIFVMKTHRFQDLVRSLA